MNHRSKTNTKIAIVAGVLLIIVAGIAGLGVYLFGIVTAPPPPDPKAAETEEVRDYLASDKFAKLSDDDKKLYVDQLRADGKFRRPGPRREDGEEPTEEEKAKHEKIRENVGSVFRKMREDRVKDYFTLPEEARVAYLDAMINEMEERRKEHQAGRETEGGEKKEDRPEGERRGGGHDGHRGPTPERMKQRIETTDPVLRAQITEFHDAMRARMEARRQEREAE